MRVAAKFVRLASVFISIFAVALIASAAQSATQLRVNFGEAYFHVDGQTATLTLPVSISNFGMYDIKYAKVKFSLYDENGNLLAEDEESRETVAPGTSWNFTLTFTVRGRVIERPVGSFAVELNVAGILPVKFQGPVGEGFHEG
jgi:hypothetical protein